MVDFWYWAITFNTPPPVKDIHFHRGYRVAREFLVGKKLISSGAQGHKSVFPMGVQR